MANRLNAKEAAALTEQRSRELEAQAKQDKQDRKLRTAQTAKQGRLWKAQGNRLIEAALNGDRFLRVGPKLIGGDLLNTLGFSIAYVDQASFLEHQRQLEFETKESERVRNLELNKLHPDTDKKIAEFLRFVGKHERYKGMDSTREKVVQCFHVKIREYSKRISSGISPRDKLFYKLFNSELFVYKPIDSLKPVTQALQDALHKLEKIRQDLPNIEVNEFEDYDFDTVDDDEDEAVQTLGIDQFKRYLEPSECHQSMELDEPQDYYQVEWSDLVDPDEWKFEDLIFEPALAWLSGANGQALLEAIESEIKKAIESASSSIQILMEWDGELCTCDIGGETYYGTPRSNNLSEILKILKYKNNEFLLEDGKSMLEISW